MIGRYKSKAKWTNKRRIIDKPPTVLRPIIPRAVGDISVEAYKLLGTIANERRTATRDNLLGHLRTLLGYRSDEREKSIKALCDRVIVTFPDGSMDELLGPCDLGWFATKHNL